MKDKKARPAKTSEHKALESTNEGSRTRATTVPHYTQATSITQGQY